MSQLKPVASKPQEWLGEIYVHIVVLGLNVRSALQCESASPLPQRVLLCTDEQIVNVFQSSSSSFLLLRCLLTLLTLLPFKQVHTFNSWFGVGGSIAEF